MKWLGPILLIGVFLRHDTAQWLHGYSPGAWFYIMGGLWELALCSLLLRFISIPLGVAALWIGILEGAQISTCRLLTTDISQVPKGANLCDHVTGLPISFIMTVVEFGLVCWAIRLSWRSVRRL